MQTVYLARHATPDWDRKDLSYHEPPGPPLTAQGMQEAQALGVYLVQAGVRRLYTSPLERCEHTAQIAAEITGASVECLPDLSEWQPSENLQTVGERVQLAFERLAEESQSVGPVAGITHGGPIMALLKALGMNERTISENRVFDHSNLVPPAGVWKASREREDGPWQLDLVFIPDQLLRLQG